VTDTTLSAESFAFVAQLLRDQCGLVLEPGKEYLVQSRLAPLAQKHQAASINLLIDRLRAGGVNGLVAEVVEAMVTTETSFFRDLHPFESLKKSVLPELILRRAAARQLNVWCAASSSGQEPYSLAILLREYFPELATWRINFLATDVSHDMLARSQAGRYSQLEVNRGLPTPLLLKWFRQEAGHWRIDERLRTTVTFSHLNLIRPWPPMPPWDLVLLRNVMIYFDSDVKRVILDRMARALARDGYLLLGGAETTLHLNDSFTRREALKAGFYQRKLS
jgi:chemotaxis protein methyltransferase CheR